MDFYVNEKYKKKEEQTIHKKFLKIFVINFVVANKQSAQIARRRRLLYKNEFSECLNKGMETRINPKNPKKIKNSQNFYA